MYAVSFLGTLARVRTVVSDRRTAFSVQGERTSWTAVEAAHDAACHLVQLCVTGTPLPSLDRTPSEEADGRVADAMSEALDELAHEERPARPDGGEPGHDGDDEFAEPEPASVREQSAEESTAAHYRVEDRLRTVDDYVLIPLERTGPAAANWYVLYELVASASAAAAVDCRTLVNRNRQQGNGEIADEWDSIATLLSDLASFVDYHVSVARWIHVPGSAVVEQAETTRILAERLNENTRER